MNPSVNQPSTVKKNRAKRKRKPGGFNVIDLLLVLVALIIVAALLYVFAPISALKTLLSSEEKTIEYTVEFVGVDKEFINQIKENDSVVDAVSKSQLGTVRVADYNYPYTVLQNVPKDHVPQGVLAEHPDKCNVLVTISGSAEYVEGEGYTINNRRIAVGETMQLRFPGYVGVGYCIDINVAP